MKSQRCRIPICSSRSLVLSVTVLALVTMLIFLKHPQTLHRPSFSFSLSRPKASSIPQGKAILPAPLLQTGEEGSLPGFPSDREELHKLHFHAKLTRLAFILNAHQNEKTSGETGGSWRLMESLLEHARTYGVALAVGEGLAKRVITNWFQEAGVSEIASHFKPPSPDSVLVTSVAWAGQLWKYTILIHSEPIVGEALAVSGGLLSAGHDGSTALQSRLRMCQLHNRPPVRACMLWDFSESSVEEIRKNLEEPISSDDAKAAAMMNNTEDVDQLADGPAPLKPLPILLLPAMVHGPSFLPLGPHRHTATDSAWSLDLTVRPLDVVVIGGSKIFFKKLKETLSDLLMSEGFDTPRFHRGNTLKRGTIDEGPSDTTERMAILRNARVCVVPTHDAANRTWRDLLTLSQVLASGCLGVIENAPGDGIFDAFLHLEAPVMVAHRDSFPRVIGGILNYIELDPNRTRVWQNKAINWWKNETKGLPFVLRDLFRRRIPSSNSNTNSSTSAASTTWDLRIDPKNTTTNRREEERRREEVKKREEEKRKEKEAIKRYEDKVKIEEEERAKRKEREKEREKEKERGRAKAKTKEEEKQRQKEKEKEKEKEKGKEREKEKAKQEREKKEVKEKDKGEGEG